MNRLGDPQSIVVFRALQLGDLLCAVPALRALRHAYPSAHIALVGLPWSQAFTARFDRYVDEFIAFPGYPGLPEIAPQIQALPEFFAAMQQRHFDLAIQMHGSGRDVNAIVALFDARHSAGFFMPGEYCPDADRFMPWPDAGHEIERLLRLMEFLGIPATDAALEFPLTAHDHAEFEALGLEPLLAGRDYIVLHPGAQLASRRWPPTRFAQVADALPDDLAVIITGSAAELPLATAVEQAMQRKAINLAGTTSLGALAILLQNARLLISNDTGLSHIAAALRVPSVVVCMASDPARWAPLDRDLHTVVLHEPVPCRPCAHAACPIGHPCALALSVERVVAAVGQKLAGLASSEALRDTGVALEAARA